MMLINISGKVRILVQNESRLVGFVAVFICKDVNSYETIHFDHENIAVCVSSYCLGMKRGIRASHIPATAGIIKGKGQVHAESKKSKVS